MKEKVKFINGPMIGEYTEVDQYSSEIQVVDQQNRVFHYRRLGASELFSFEYEVEHVTVHKKG